MQKVSWNPLEKPLAEAEGRVADLSRQLLRRTEDLDWYQRANRPLLQETLVGLQSEIAQCRDEVSRIAREIENLESQGRILAASIKSLLNPKNWFDPDQRQLRHQAARIKESIRRQAGEHSAADRLRHDADKRFQTAVDEIHRYDNFDSIKKSAERRGLEEQMREVREQAAQLSLRKKAIDANLDPILAQLRVVLSEKVDAEGELQDARDFERQLARADNSYERAMIHQSCERQFGFGSPGKVVAAREKLISRCARDVEKLERRAQAEAKRGLREIRELIVDGNNLCYSESEFIGLDAVRALIPVLAVNYEVTVVFDASIRRLLESGDDELRRILGDRVKTHVVATRSSADATVLELASDRETTFVISNDRFVEFPDRAAVRYQRFIRHEIIGGKVMIHDLGISATYGRR